jgi:hypothetical protein
MEENRVRINCFLVYKLQGTSPYYAVVQGLREKGPSLPDMNRQYWRFMGVQYWGLLGRQYWPYMESKIFLTLAQYWA